MGLLSKFSNLPTTKSLQLFGLFPDDDIDDDDDDDDDDRPFYQQPVGKRGVGKRGASHDDDKEEDLASEGIRGSIFSEPQGFYKPVWFNLAFGCTLTMFLCLLPRLGRSF